MLYLPIFYYPIQKDDRATGILIPTYGSTTLRGQSISNAFFWAINRSQDATVVARLVLEDRPGRRRRVPLHPRPGFVQGNTRISILDEHETTYVQPTAR